MKSKLDKLIKLIRDKSGLNVNIYHSEVCRDDSELCITIKERYSHYHVYDTDVALSMIYELTQHDYEKLLDDSIRPKEPELYWQWRNPNTGVMLLDGNLVKGFESGHPFSHEKHAGPWIKTDEGFRKHESWEQF